RLTPGRNYVWSAYGRQKLLLAKMLPLTLQRHGAAPRHVLTDRYPSVVLVRTVEPRTPAELFAFAESSRGDVSRSEALLGLLDERHVVYQRADSLSVARMRAAVLSALAHC